MSEEIKGSVGSSPVVYEVQIGDDLSVALSLGYKDEGSAAEVAMQVKFPLAAILDKLAAKSGNALIQGAEGILISAAEAYIKSKSVQP